MRSWGRRIGTTLGIIAVAVSLYLPIHIARDIVGAAMDAIAAAAASTYCHAAPVVADAGSSGTAIPYHHDGGTRHHHHDNTCPICGSVSTATAAILLPTPVPLAEPKVQALPVRFEPSALGRTAEVHTPYAPRAPPRSA